MMSVLAQLVYISNGDVRTLQFLLLDGAKDGGSSAKNQLHASATGLQAAFEQVCSKEGPLLLADSSDIASWGIS